MHFWTPLAKTLTPLGKLPQYNEMFVLIICFQSTFELVFNVCVRARARACLCVIGVEFSCYGFLSFN